MEVERFINNESMDLNALYQQDVDLGINWQMFEPTKNVKDVSFNQKPTFDDQINFIVDGETGEYLPMPQQDDMQQKQIDTDNESGQVDFNIEDFLDGNINQQNVQPVNIQPAADTINKELWDDIATLSDAYLALDSGELEEKFDNGSPMDENIAFQPVNQFQGQVMGSPAQIQMQEHRKSPQNEQYFNMQSPYHTFPTPPYAEQSKSPQTFAHPTSVTFPPENNKSFGPTGLEEVKLAEMLMSEQNELLAQLDNVSQINMGNSVPPPLATDDVTSPGQWFFGGDEPDENFSQVLTELDVMNNIPNQAGAYLNPTNAPYVPPPINTNQGRVGMVSESESLDSGYGEVGSMDIEMHEVEATSVLMPVDQNEFTQSETGKDKQLRKMTLRESRDVKKARELNISLTMDQIINSPVEEYNELLARANLTPTQQSLVRDIRRRGKNKVAAQNCRKRKIETISSMETDIDGLNKTRQDLLQKQKELDETKRAIEAKYNQLYKQIFSSLRDESGLPYDQSRYSLQQVEGAIILVPGSYGNKIGSGNSSKSQQSKSSVAFFDLSKVKIEQEI